VKKFEYKNMLIKMASIEEIRRAQEDYLVSLDAQEEPSCSSQSEYKELINAVRKNDESANATISTITLNGAERDYLLLMAVRFNNISAAESLVDKCDRRKFDRLTDYVIEHNLINEIHYRDDNLDTCRWLIDTFKLSEEYLLKVTSEKFMSSLIGGLGPKSAAKLT
jgi:hypothetical protein